MSGQQHLWTSALELEFLRQQNKYRSFWTIFRELLASAETRTEPERRMVVVDVGANCGWFSLDCSEQFPARTTIYAMEPFSAPFRCLSTNALQQNRQLMEQQGGLDATQIMPMQLAAAASSHAREGAYLPHYSLLSGFHVRDDEDRGALERLAGRDLTYEFTMHREEVACTRLDEWMMDLRIDAIDLLKVDADKAELEALASLGTMLADRVKCVLAEVHECNKAQVVRLLQEAGFANVHVSDPAPPSFCSFPPPGFRAAENGGEDGVDGERPRRAGMGTGPRTQDWHPRLNSYLLWASKF